MKRYIRSNNKANRSAKPKYFANMVSCSSDDEGMYSRRYSPGSVGDDGSEELYSDTQFNSFEEAAEWGIHHDCTHVFDRKTGEYISIADGTVAKKLPYFVWDKVWYDFNKEFNKENEQ